MSKKQYSTGCPTDEYLKKCTKNKYYYYLGEYSSMFCQPRWLERFTISINGTKIRNRKDYHEIINKINGFCEYLDTLEKTEEENKKKRAIKNE